MSKWKSLAVLAGCAVVTCSGLVRAAENPSADSLSLTRPIYAADESRKPLMAVLDKAGVAKTLDDWHINVGGFIEGSWTYNFDSPDDGINAGRVFDFEDQDLSLNQWDIFVERTVDASKGKFDVGGRMEWIWGSDSRLIHSNGLFDDDGVGDGPNEQFDLNQAYITLAIPVGSGLTVTVGKFVTLLGYEYINPTLNPLFSHSYLFGFAIPFTHTGVIGKYNINDKWSVTAGITRGWEQSLEDNNDAIDFIGQVGFVASDKCTITLNVITGPEREDNDNDYRTVIDGTIAYKVGDNLTLALNGDYGWESDAGDDGDDATWYGAAGYASYMIDSHFTINGRIEYFNDDDGARGLGTAVWEGTIGVAIKPWPDHAWVGGLVFRPEVRWDHSDDDIFNDASDDNQYTFGADLIFAY